MKKKIKYIVVALIILIVVVISYVLNNQEDNNYVSAQNETIEEKEEKNEKIFVDIKGEVKNPGVYEMDNDSIVNDVIKKSGGFTKNAYTKNINLSKKVTNEMVIYIFSKKEMTTTEHKNDAICVTEVIHYDNCITEEVKEENKLVNINTATKEELTSVSGIGDSKADSIISYREKTPFTKIEDIKNVSGIGDSLFEKIKEYITV